MSHFWYQSYLFIVIFYYVNRGVIFFVSELGFVPVPTRDVDLLGRGFDSVLTRFNRFKKIFKFIFGDLGA